MPAVSVVMPYFNSANTIEEALDSLSHQTLTDFEVIAVDDGSTDDSRRILEEWAHRDDRIVPISQPHQGIIKALNQGLVASRAPYVARMDADDWCHPDRLAHQADFLNTHPEVSVVGSLVSGFPEGQVRKGFRIYLNWLNSLVTDEDIRREIFIESPFAHPSVMFRLEHIQQLGGYQEFGWPEDYDLWLRLYCSGAHFGKLPQVLLKWREHPKRLTRTDGRYSLENFLRTKAHYLAKGPLDGRDAVMIWGAGMVGRRISKYLLRQSIPLAVFVDIDTQKIGRTRRGLPIIPPGDLPPWWERYENPAVLAAVGARGARTLIRSQLQSFGLKEGRDWWGVA